MRRPAEVTLDVGLLVASVAIGFLGPLGTGTERSQTTFFASRVSAFHSDVIFL
jgi:hypothetical protein